MIKKLLLLTLLIPIALISQTIDTIEVTQFKTTQVVFNKNIGFVEPGTGDLQVKFKMVDNILILQSVVGADEFITTNLFIKTDDNVYNPIIKYSEKPKNQTIAESFLKPAMSGKNNSNQTISNSSPIQAIPTKNYNLSPTDQSLYNLIVRKTEQFKSSRTYETGMWAKFYAHYVKGDKYYFKVEYDNTTDLEYKIEHIFFSVKNIRKRNSSVTQKELTPTRILGETEIIPARQKRFIIYEFKTFSINKDEEMMIEIKEKDGARNLVFGIPYFVINKPLTL